MCEKTILENGGTLKSVHDFYKNQEMCNKAVDNFPHALEFFSKCYKPQNMCNKTVDTYFLPCFMTPEMCDKAISRFFLYLILFLINIKLKKCVAELFIKLLFSVHCPDKYITQRICDQAVDDSIAL